MAGDFSGLFLGDPGRDPFRLEWVDVRLAALVLEISEVWLARLELFF